MNSCEICGSQENIIRHHVSYEPEEIELLCLSCHRKEHYRNKELSSGLKTIRVSDEDHNQLVAIAATLTLETKEKKTIPDAIHFLLESASIDRLLQKVLEAKQ